MTTPEPRKEVVSLAVEVAIRGTLSLIHGRALPGRRVLLRVPLRPERTNPTDLMSDGVMARVRIALTTKAMTPSGRATRSARQGQITRPITAAGKAALPSARTTTPNDMSRVNHKIDPRTIASAASVDQAAPIIPNNGTTTRLRHRLIAPPRMVVAM